MSSFWKESDSNSPYETYKNEVVYDYVIKASKKIKIVTSNNKEAEYEDFDTLYMKDGEYYFEKQVNSMLNDEDFINYYYPQIGLGRVYCKLDNDIDTELSLVIGISKIDQQQEFTEDDLKNDTDEFLYSIIENIDPFTLEYDDIYEEVKNELKVISDQENINFEIVERNNKEEAKNIEFDKKLVKESNILFEKNNNIIKFHLTNEGLIEYFEGNKLIETNPFSKTYINNKCINLIKENYIIKEADIENNLNKAVTTSDNQNSEIDGAIDNIEQGIEKVNQLQDLKDELLDKVDNLVNEEKLIIQPFPITDEVNNNISIKELQQIDLNDCLTGAQIDWIANNLGSTCEEVKQGMIDLLNQLQFYDEAVISIACYINSLLNYKKLGGE